MSIAMFFIIGMGIGASVLMSEFYGAQDARSLRREFSTTLIISLALSAAIGAGLFLLAGPLLRLVNTPPEIHLKPPAICASSRWAWSSQGSTIYWPRPLDPLGTPARRWPAWWRAL